jgi:ribonuclease P protein component
METLKRSRDYRKVIANGKREYLETITAYRLPNQMDITRVGISVTRKVGGSVERNRIKRRIKEAIRRNASFLPSGEDVIISPRQGYSNVEYTDIERDIRRLGRRKDHEEEDI